LSISDGLFSFLLFFLVLGSFAGCDF
jgi:hypothetical protein